MIKRLFLLRYSLKFWLGAIVLIFGALSFSLNVENVRDVTNPSNGAVESEHRSISEMFYQTIQLFTLESGVEDFNSWHLEVARIAAALLFIATAYSLLARVFNESYDSFRVQFLSGHTIICGLGKVGQQIVDDVMDELKDKRRWYHFSEWTLPRVVVVELDPSKTRIRRLRLRGGLVKVGDATDEELLESIGVLKAKRIFVATGSDEANAEVVFDCLKLMRAAGYQKTRKQRLECFVQLSNPTIFKLFSKQTAPFLPQLPMDVRVFNPAANCARLMIERDDVLAHRPKGQDVGLFVIIGFGKVGQSLALQNAELAHFENGKRLRMLIVEDDIETVARQFTAQFGTFTHEDPVPNAWEDVAFDPADDDWASRNKRVAAVEQVSELGVEYLCNAQFVESPKHFSDRGFIEMLRRVTNEDNVRPVVLVCRDQDRKNFDIAGILADQLEAGRSSRLAIYTWLPEQAALRAALESTESDKGTHCVIKQFGGCDETASLKGIVDQDVESLAKALHKDYQDNYCAADKTEPCRDWASLPETFRQANRGAAVHARIKLHVNKELDSDPPNDTPTIDILAEMEHNRWMAERLLGGWRYGPVSDNANQFRPTIQAWPQLSEEDKQKDRDQVRAVLRVIEQQDSSKTTGESSEDKNENGQATPPTNA